MLKYIGEHDHLLTIMKCRQLTWFGYVFRKKGSLANTMLHGGTRKTESFGDHVFQEPLTCHPGGLKAREGGREVVLSTKIILSTR